MGGRKQKPLRYIKGLGLQFVSKGSEWGLASMGKKHMQGRVKKKNPGTLIAAASKSVESPVV
jgi:hypothetical protein